MAATGGWSCATTSWCCGPEGPVEVDVRRFEQLTAHARSSRELADLRAAAAAYSGDLLPEDRFEDWAVGPRAELRESLCDLLTDLAERAAADGHEAEALEALQRALAVDPLHERAVRAVMRQHAAGGRRSEALARYDRLRGDLQEAYGTDPDPETRRLYRELLATGIEVTSLRLPSAAGTTSPPDSRVSSGANGRSPTFNACWPRAGWSRSPGWAAPARHVSPRRRPADASIPTPTGSGWPTSCR
jgi:DNA-binding SARP family transcriptional activator